MRWRESIDIRTNGLCPDSIFDDLEAAIDDDEAVRLVSTPVSWEHPRGTSQTGNKVGLLVSARHVLLGRKPLLGATKIHDFHVSEFVQFAVSPTHGYLASWRYEANLQKGQLCILFSAHDEAEVVSAQINRMVAFWRRDKGM